MQTTASKLIFLLIILLITATTDAAPVPVFKDSPSLESAHRAPPQAIRHDIESTRGEIPGLIFSMKRNIRFARAEKEKANLLAEIERW